MTQSPLPKLLLAVLAVLAVLTAFWSYSTARNSDELREYQRKLNAINQGNMFLSSLAGDLAEYSKKNPAIDPLLVDLGIKPGKSNAAPVAPATKPPGK